MVIVDDRRERTLAESYSLEYCGIIWVLDRSQALGRITLRNAERVSPAVQEPVYPLCRNRLPQRINFPLGCSEFARMARFQL